MNADILKEKAYHAQEAIRIKGVLDNLSSEFAADGIVKTILRSRVEQEKSKADSTSDNIWLEESYLDLTNLKYK